VSRRTGNRIKTFSAPDRRWVLSVAASQKLSVLDPPGRRERGTYSVFSTGLHILQLGPIFRPLPGWGRSSGSAGAGGQLTKCTPTVGDCNFLPPAPTGRSPTVAFRFAPTSVAIPRPRLGPWRTARAASPDDAARAPGPRNNRRSWAVLNQLSSRTHRFAEARKPAKKMAGPARSLKVKLTVLPAKTTGVGFPYLEGLASAQGLPIKAVAVIAFASAVSNW